MTGPEGPVDDEARSPVVLPLPGTASVAHVEDDLTAAHLLLDPEDLVAPDLPSA